MGLGLANDDLADKRTEAIIIATLAALNLLFALGTESIWKAIFESCTNALIGYVIYAAYAVLCVWSIIDGFTIWALIGAANAVISVFYYNMCRISVGLSSADIDPKEIAEKVQDITEKINEASEQSTEEA